MKKTCPFRFEHCATFSREETYDSQENANHANNITKIFAKDCALGSECSKPISHCNEQSSAAETCSYECCHGYLCNAGTISMANPHGSLTFLFAIVLTIIFFLMDERSPRETRIVIVEKLALLQCPSVRVQGSQSVSRPAKTTLG